MPTYNYACPNGHTLEDFQPMSAPTERVCEECHRFGSRADDCPAANAPVMMKRVIGTGGGVIWKGGSPTRRFHK